MKKDNFQEKQLNAFTMWGSAVNGKTVFARQITGDTMTEYNRLDRQRVQVPVILVGFDGEMGRDVGDVLEENRQLKEELEKRNRADQDYTRKRLDGTDSRVEDMDNRLYALENKNKKWYQFWK